MSAPVYEIGDFETTTHALQRLGFFRYSNSGVIVRNEGRAHVATTRTVFDTNDWIRRGCPDLDRPHRHDPRAERQEVGVKRRMLVAEIAGAPLSFLSFEGLAGVLRDRGISGEVRCTAGLQGSVVAFVSARKVRFP